VDSGYICAQLMQRCLAFLTRPLFVPRAASRVDWSVITILANGGSTIPALAAMS
jgi:hypothetical protein